METSLHRQLKMAYALDAARTEVVVGNYRIDAVRECGELVEIQHAALGALKSKTAKLLAHRSKPRVRIVKPIVARKWIVTHDSETGQVVRRRLSPKRGQLSDIFTELVYFAGIFPNNRLTLELVLVELEEARIPKLEHRFKRKNYVTLEQTMLSIVETLELRTSQDLWQLLPALDLPKTFDTSELSHAIARPRWFAQKVAYCLRNCDAIRCVGKRGNSQLYTLVKGQRRSRKKAG